MSKTKYESLLEFKDRIEKASTPDEIDEIVDELLVCDNTILNHITFSAGWKTLKQRDLISEISKIKKLLDLSIEQKISNIPNITIIKNVLALIDEGKSLEVAPNKISPFVRKVNNAMGKEIDFPEAVLSKLNTEDATVFGIGGHICRTNKEDLDGVIIRLENYLEKLNNTTNEKAKFKNKLEQPHITINNTNNNNNNNENSVEIAISIENKMETVINEMENDPDLDDKEIAECKEQLEILKQCINDKPKSKWEKCKGVFTWLGDKTIKFGKWFIPIMAEILINKATTPTV